MVGKTLLMATLLILLASCGPNPDLTPCDGWLHGTPTTQQQLMLASSAEKRGRECANLKLNAAAKFYARRG